MRKAGASAVSAGFCMSPGPLSPRGLCVLRRTTRRVWRIRAGPPHTTGRKAWLPVMVEIYLVTQTPSRCRRLSHLESPGQERSLGADRRAHHGPQPSRLYGYSRHGGAPHPARCAPAASFKATAAHEYWFIDGRMMDFAIEGHRWWSLIILDGYSRTMLAGAVAPTEARWVALTVLYAAIRRYGVPRPPDFR